MFELLLQLIDLQQILTAILIAVAAIILRSPAFLRFLSQLAVLIGLFLIFLSAILALSVLPPVP